MLLAASSASFAGLKGGQDLLEHALATTDRYWVETDGRSMESFDRTFMTVDSYRGQNANMHLTEAYLAAYEFTRDDELLNRASRIASHIAGSAAKSAPGAWRLPEHFDEQWQPIWEHNRSEPRHPFRPYGSQPGHWLEWSKLLLQMKGLGVDEDWMLPAATHLFDGAFDDAWADNGGFCYTVDWDGVPVVREKFFWEIAEGIGASAYLARFVGHDRFAEAYGEMWEFAVHHMIDHDAGSWFPELDPDSNGPVVHTWVGKPDLYHAYQATFYAQLPLDRGIAAWSADANSGIDEE